MSAQAPQTSLPWEAARGTPLAEGRLGRPGGVGGGAERSEAEGAEPPLSVRPRKREEISVTPLSGGDAPEHQAVPKDPIPKDCSQAKAYRRELYRIKVGIQPILFAERPALGLCGRFGSWSYQNKDDRRNGTIDLVKRPREVVGPDGTKRVEWRAGLAHVQTCKNPHVCPTCSNFLRIHRAEEVNAALADHRIQRTLMLTLTTRHFAGDSPAWLFKQWRAACKLAFSGKAWANVKEEMRIIGQIRAMENTHGRANGWHIHQHRVLFIEEYVIGSIINEESIADLEAWFFTCWCHAVAKTFGEKYVPNAAHGVRVTRTPPGEYLCKLGLELVDVGTKVPKSVDGEPPRRTFFSIAADAASGDVESMALVREYASAVYGEKQIHWTPGLKERFGIGENEPDIDTESADLDDQPEVIGGSDADDWRKVATEEGRVVVTLPCEYVESVWSKSYGKRTPFGVPFVPAVLEAMNAHEDDAAAAAAAWEVLNQVEYHGVKAYQASAAEADAKLREWGRPVFSAKHRRRNAHRAKCAHPETCPLCAKVARERREEMRRTELPRTLATYLGEAP